ncbi:UNVERIFIED_CONTAM: hypothetical protein PYX00_010353 [Menopon gallinae]|uniref:mRNA-decapping enzyme C-terminal domain-containing protein n=1 Tax=Menopon gallinae TaxID=328185 RepID=A0AAW2HFV9_9NEOP
MADVPFQAILNEAALKRFDPYVKEILDTAKFVALHTFNPEEDQWERTNVEGSLFVYSRTGEPFYNILVLNRLNTTNLIEPISNKLDIQLHESFLIYRNTKLCIYGIWFYEKEECTRLAALIQKLMKQSGGSKQCNSNVNANGGSNVDIYSMLSKAQEVYNSSKTSNSSKNVVNQVQSDELEQTPQSVMEFFAKAGGAPQKTTVPPAPAARVVMGRSQPVATSENNEKTSITGLIPSLHQLMSNPVHTVEHIEKQQRSVTPQTSDPSNLKIHMGVSAQSVDTEHKPVLDESGKKSGKLENGFNFLRISSPSFSLLSQTAPESTEIGSLPAARTPLDTPQKPALMPPAMFTPSSCKESVTRESFTDSDDFKPEPLTRNQLLQALNYLLKNDPEFMTKIHEAYVKSLTDKVL